MINGFGAINAAWVWKFSSTARNAMLRQQTDTYVTICDILKKFPRQNYELWLIITSGS